jgi:hypothetical protein
VGPHFLRAGIGFGGSCLPKDMRALVSVGRRQGVRARLLESVLEVNELQRTRFVEKAEALLGGFAGRAMGVLGLSFKGRTSDVRESPAIAIASTLERRGAVVRTYDPAAEGEARRVLHGVAFCPDAYEAADGADAILVLSDWPEFADLDWARIAARAPRALVLDGRGMKALRQRVAAAGLGYVGPGMRRAEMPAPMVGARCRRTRPRRRARTRMRVRRPRGSTARNRLRNRRASQPPRSPAPPRPRFRPPAHPAFRSPPRPMRRSSAPTTGT